MRIAVVLALISLVVVSVVGSCVRQTKPPASTIAIWKESIQYALLEEAIISECYASSLGDSWQFAIPDSNGHANALAALAIERFIVKASEIGLHTIVVSVTGIRGKSVIHSIIRCRDEEFVVASGTSDARIDHVFVVRISYK